MIKFLQGSTGSMMAGGIAFLLTMVALLQRPLSAEVRINAEPEVAPQTFWERHNPEVDLLIQELQNEKKALDKREAELRELAIRLAAERAEINQVTQRVAQLQAEFDQNVIRIKEEEIPNLKKLARMYSSMSPTGVSAIFKELDDATVVKVLTFMKQDESAALLDTMAKEGDVQAKRAATIFESLRKTVGAKPKNL